jgi:hypothetical protein
MSDFVSRVQRIRDVRAIFTRTFLFWSLGSIAAGAVVLAVEGHAFARTVAVHFVIWGAINLVFALMGVQQGARVKRAAPAEGEIDEAQRLLHSLRFNQKLNWLWLGMGVVLLILGAALQNAGLLAHGVGVAVQGGYLFAFDRVFERKMKALI